MISSYRTYLTDLASKIAFIQGIAVFHWAVISANGRRQRWKLRCLSHGSDQLALLMKHREQQNPVGAPEAALLPQRHPGRHLMTEKILKLQLRFRYVIYQERASFLLFCIGVSCILRRTLRSICLYKNIPMLLKQKTI